MGHIPWIINNIPLNDEPTMIVGIDISGNEKNKDN